MVQGHGSFLVYSQLNRTCQSQTQDRSRDLLGISLLLLSTFCYSLGFSVALCPLSSYQPLPTSIKIQHYQRNPLCHSYSPPLPLPTHFPYLSSLSLPHTSLPIPHLSPPLPTHFPSYLPLISLSLSLPSTSSHTLLLLSTHPSPPTSSTLSPPKSPVASPHFYQDSKLKTLEPSWTSPSNPRFLQHVNPLSIYISWQILFSTFPVNMWPLLPLSASSTAVKLNHVHITLELSFWSRNSVLPNSPMILTAHSQTP